MKYPNCNFPVRSLLLPILGWLWMIGGVIAEASPWRSSLYPANWTPPGESVSFATDKLIQDFSYAGYRRGEEPIPDVAGPVFDVTTYGADPTAAGDSTVAIQNAINAAAAAGGGVVFLPAGEFRVSPQGDNNFALRISSSNIVLRGAGTAATFLLNTSYEMRGKALLQISPTSTPLGTLRDITADLPGPTRRIPVENAGSFAPGNIVRLQWAFTDDWIIENNQQTWWNGTERPGNSTYFREVVATNSAEGWIEIDVPTRYSMNTRDAAQLRTISGQLTHVGIESLALGNLQHPGSGWGEEDHTDPTKAAYDTHASWLVRFSNVRDSWVSSVHSRQAAANTRTCHMLSNGISLSNSMRVTLQHCEMRRPQYGGGGGNGYMYRIQTSNDCLVKNSVADFSRHGFVISHAGTSGNVFFQCEDRETQRATGSSPTGYTTNGSGSDNHMHFSHSNLWDQCHAHNSFYTAHHRSTSGTTPHGVTSAHSVYWNTTGSGTRYNDIVRSGQLQYGYVIGTGGTRSGATNPTGGNTAPADHLEGIGQGASMEVPSLYTNQLARRMQGILVHANGNGITASTSAYPLGGAIYTYGSAPVSTLWSQLSGPAAAVFADASSLTTTVALPELGTYVLELSATDGSNSGSAQVVIQVALSAPRSAAHFIRGESQNTDSQPPGYFTSVSDIIGTSGTSGNRDDRNVVLGYTLPTLPVGTLLESVTLAFEITQGRDSTGAANLPELHAYLLDSPNPAESGTGFFYHGVLDNSAGAKRVGTTSVTISGTTDNTFPAGEQARFFTLTGEALALLQGFYNGHTPTRSTVYFRFNLSVDPSVNDFRRYRVDTSASGSSLYFKSNAVPSVSAGPDQTVLMTGTTPWTPAQLSTAAWYDASDPATLTIQNGNAVSEWRDKSGKNNHATQSTAAVRPTTGTATLGGLNAIAFRIGDGTSKQFLSAPDHASLNLDSSGGANVFAVMKYLGFVDNGSSGLNVALAKGQILGAQSAYGIRVSSGNALGYQAGSNGQVNTTDFSNQEVLFTGTGNFAASSAQIFVNGQLRSSATPAGDFTSNNNAPLHIGRDSSTGRYSNVDFGEIVVLGGALTADERQRTEGYLAHKWGLAGELPAGHPSKDAAPVNSGVFAIAALDGTATDADDDPLTFTWSVVSGPGGVSFADPSAPDSTATFSSAGTYVLRLTASDGFSANSDEVTITVEAPAVEPIAYDVYLIAGQSNADGRGYTSDLTGGLAAYAGSQPNVKLFYVNPANSDPVNPTYNTGWTTLAPGYSVVGTPGSLPSTRFGFEVSLGKALAAKDPERNIAIIKVSRGGTNLHTQWDPAGGDNFMWQTFANKVPEAMAALTANGDTAEIRGMFWHQGESDGSGSNPTYQSDLAGFIAACRTLTGKADLPFAIGELERDDVTPTVSGRNYQLAAMANVAAADPNAFVVSSAGLLTYDGTHFTSAAYITFGERFATALHDFEQGLNYSVTYNGNGSTGGNVPVDSTSYNSDASATVLGAGDLVKSGYIFSAWNAATDGSGTSYTPGSVFVITANTTLHAQWTPKTTPTVDPWPTAAPITQGQPLSAATLSGGGASVAGNFAYINPSTVPPAGIHAADVIFTPEDTINNNTVLGIVNVTVRTAFESWAGNGDIIFTGDANRDGVADGMAWLLGADDPAENATALLPTVIGNDGPLEVTFSMLNQAARGAAVMKLQHGPDLEAWIEVTIPEESGTHDGVEFLVTPNGTLIKVVATIPASAASGGKLFVRLSGAEN